MEITMSLEIIIIPCLSDNYAYLLRCKETGQVGVIDVPDATPIIAKLKEQKWPLHYIFITHHHQDHINGVNNLQDVTKAKIIGAKEDAHRLPKLDISLTDGDQFNLGNQTADIIDVSGHTIGHIAFLFKTAKVAFTGDSLMALGCGRIVEGTQSQMWDSLQKFIDLPNDMLIYSGHEYALSNAKFALSIDPNNLALRHRIKAIKETLATKGFNVPASLELERATNPFLRASTADMKQLLNMKGATDAHVFAEIRTRKDNF